MTGSSKIHREEETMNKPVEAVHIMNASDPRIAEYVALRDRGLRTRNGRDGVFIGEAALVVEIMLESKGLTRSVLASRRRAERMAMMIAESNSPETPLFVADDEERPALLHGSSRSDQRFCIADSSPNQSHTARIYIFFSDLFPSRAGQYSRNALDYFMI